jgi:drug/metabolite transporter (DMT)-like permease
MANIGAVGAVACALCYATSALVIRHWGRTETSLSFPFYANLLALVVLGALLPAVYVPPTGIDLAVTAAGGILSGLALTCLLTAFRIAPSPVVAPFQYTQMLWGVLYGLLLFGDAPGWHLAAGGSVVVGSGLYLLRREAAAKMRAASGAAPG